MLPLRQGAPRLGTHPIRPHVFKRRLLCEKRVQLHLIHRRDRFSRLTEVREDGRIEVRHPDGPRHTLPAHLLHRAVRAVVIPHRLMDEVEVHIIEPQLPQRGLQGRFRGLAARVLHPEFRRHEQFLAGQTALSDRSAHRLLVAVCGRSVDQPIAGFEGVKHNALALVPIRYLKDPEPLQGHHDPVVQLHVLHRHCLLDS